MGMLLLLWALGLLLAAAVDDSLMAPGVSHALARHRAQHISDVRYELALDVTRRDTVVGNATISFTRRGGDDVIMDFRGISVDMPGAEWRNGHLRIPASEVRDGPNTIKASFKAPIAPAGAS